MRKYVAPILSAVMLFGTGVVVSGCTVETRVMAKQPPPAAPPPAPKRARRTPKVKEFNMEGERIKLPGNIVFETGSDQLKPESEPVLEIVQDYLGQKTQVTLLRIEGHTDSDGNKAGNQALSEKRAMAVARWLVAQGVECSRLIPVGFGQDKPIADNATPDGKAQNRRVAFVNAALNGKPIGGLDVGGGGKVAGDPCR